MEQGAAGSGQARRGDRQGRRLTAQKAPKAQTATAFATDVETGVKHELDLSGYDGIRVRVRVRGDGRRYTWRLTTDARWRGRQVGYWADFDTVKGEWAVADIPFSSFNAQWRGRMLEGERWKSRVLVVSAASAADEKLVRQLADVEATRAAFAERDMLLVVLLDAKGSRAGDRALTADEVRAARRDVEIDDSAFALRLVGKDGGVKRAASGVTTMRSLYDLIDSMPMRRDEMTR